MYMYSWKVLQQLISKWLSQRSLWFSVFPPLPRLPTPTLFNGSCSLFIVWLLKFMHTHTNMQFKIEYAYERKCTMVFFLSQLHQNDCLQNKNKNIHSLIILVCKSQLHAHYLFKHVVCIHLLTDIKIEHQEAWVTKYYCSRIQSPWGLCPEWYIWITE